MKKFEFKSQICTDINQSRKLLALGLKKETADMYRPPSWGGGEIIGYYAPAVVLFNDHFAEEPNDLPAWSLHRLIEMYTERYLACSVNLKIFTYEWLINEIEIHIKEGDFNKDYLEEK